MGAPPTIASMSMLGRRLRARSTALVAAVAIAVSALATGPGTGNACLERGGPGPVMRAVDIQDRGRRATARVRRDGR